jgi:hypothetical protein
MKMYVTTKIVGAFKEKRNGQEGYAVVYPDGYQSWCPKKQFEKTAREIASDISAITTLKTLYPKI